MTSDSVWPLCALGELTVNHDSRRVPVRSQDRRPGPYPYYGASGVVDSVDDYLFEGLHVLVAEDGENLRSRKTPVAFLASGRFWVNNHAHVLTGAPGRADTRFLAYALASTDISAYISGSAQPKLSQQALSSIGLAAPPFDEQRQIAGVLGALDDKIVHNERFQHRLFRLSQADFARTFRSPSERTPLGDVAEVIDCLHSRKPERRESGRPLLQVWNIRNDGLLDMTDTYWVDPSDYQEWTRRLETRDGDCVITNVGRIGAVAQVVGQLTAALGRNMTGVRVQPDFPYPTFIASALLSAQVRREIEALTDAGTVMGALNVKSIPKLRLPASDLSNVERFEVTHRPIWQLRRRLLDEAACLRAVRDALLPKLVSGKIRVPA